MVLFQQNERRWASIAGAGSGREAVFTEADWRCRAESFGADDELEVTWVSSPAA
jgi:hypothetical protein